MIKTISATVLTAFVSMSAQQKRPSEIDTRVRQSTDKGNN
jgi:hypothetical protein